MQDIYLSALARLNLSPQDQLSSKPPHGVNQHAIGEALSAAIAEFGGGGDPMSEEQRLLVLAEAGRKLLYTPGHLQEALHLTEIIPNPLKDRAAIADIRLLATFRLGRHDAAIQEAERLLSTSLPGSNIRKVIRRTLRHLHIERELPLHLSFLHDYWGDIDRALENPIQAIHPDRDFPLVERLSRRLAEYSGIRSPEAVEKFTDAMRWGAQWHRSTVYLNQIYGHIVRSKNKSARSDYEEKVVELQKSVQSLFRAPDTSTITECINRGRGVLIVHAHAGLAMCSDLGLQSHGVPLATISQVPRLFSAHRPHDIHINTSGPDVAMAFTKLAKAMKKAPRIASIYVDGPAGEQVPIRVLDRDVLIGRGAATLAFHSKAKVFFTTTHWTGASFRYSLVPGPEVVDHPDRDDFEQAFNQFYADCIARILLGPPEDMAPDGGFWRFFIN